MLPLVDQQRQGRTADRKNKGRGVTLFLQNQVKVPTKSVQSFLRLAGTNRQADRSKIKFYICKLTGCVLLEEIIGDEDGIEYALWNVDIAVIQFQMA